MLEKYKINFGQVLTILATLFMSLTIIGAIYVISEPRETDLSSRIKTLENVLLDTFVKNQELVIQAALRIEGSAKVIETDANAIQGDVKILSERATNIEERATLLEQRAADIQKSIEERGTSSKQRDKRLITIEDNVKLIKELLEKQPPVQQ